MSEQTRAPVETVATSPAKPSHYKVVCLSIYTTDLVELDRKVVQLKQQHGWSGANRSHLVRIALSRLTDADLEAIARERRR